MDLWDSKNVVDALDQPHCRIITEELRQQPRQRPISSQTVNSYSMIDVGNLPRFRPQAGFKRLLAILQPTVAVVGKLVINDTNIV